MKVKESPEQIVRRLCEKYGVTYGKWMEKYFFIAKLPKEFEEKEDGFESIDSFEVVKFIRLLVEAKKIKVCGDRDYSVEVNSALARHLWLYLNTLLEMEKDGEYQAYYEKDGDFSLCGVGGDLENPEAEPEIPEGAKMIVNDFKQPLKIREFDSVNGERVVQHPFFLEPYTEDEFSRILRYENHLKQIRVSRERQTQNQKLGKWVCRVMAEGNKKELLVAGEDGKGKLQPKPNEFDGVSPTSKYCFIGDLLFEAGFVEKHNRLSWENLSPHEKQRIVRDWENSYKKNRGWNCG